MHGNLIQQHLRCIPWGSYSSSEVVSLVCRLSPVALRTSLGRYSSVVASPFHLQRPQVRQDVERPEMIGYSLRAVDDTDDYSTGRPQQSRGLFHTRKMHFRPFLIIHRPETRPLVMRNSSHHLVCATHGAYHGTVETVTCRIILRYTTVAMSILCDW